VIEFIPNERFLVKLGDPGLPVELTENDVPWIAIECYDDLSSCRDNLKSDIWSYATTIWEIFSRGASMAQFHNNRPMQFFSSGRRLPKPAECAEFHGIYELMLKGWDIDPDRRFPPQTIFSCLLSASKYKNKIVFCLESKLNQISPNFQQKLS
jgi:Janus kinase 2